MVMSGDSNQDDNVYFIDHESGGEMARLLTQDRMLTKGMGGLFPQQFNPATAQRILDLGCGPGGWVHEVAFAHPKIELVPHVIDFSFGTDANYSIYENWTSFYKMLQPFFLSLGVITQEEADQAYEQMLIEVRQEEFRGLIFMVSAVGKRP